MLYAKDGENWAIRRSSEGLSVENRCLDADERSSAAVDDLMGDVCDTAGTPSSYAAPV